ncbi:MAG: hypothetical protein ACK4TP_08970 [Hyphomicrobium sp.]|jgi:hypothetical protein
MLKRILVGICVLATAVPLAAGATGNELKPVQIAGRWMGETYTQRNGGALTLDIVACGNAWCGIKVEAGDKCGGTALKVEHVEPLPEGQSDSLQFNGSLELAPGTEPFVVQAWLMPPSENGSLTLQITGDTGGEYRAYRRSFPFEAQLARIKDAVCHAPQTVSSLR